MPYTSRSMPVTSMHHCGLVTMATSAVWASRCVPVTADRGHLCNRHAACPDLTELIEGITRAKDAADETEVRLITTEITGAEDKLRKQLETLLKIKQGTAVGGHQLRRYVRKSDP
jgi:hypothetical protein